MSSGEYDAHVGRMALERNNAFSDLRASKAEAERLAALLAKVVDWMRARWGEEPILDQAISELRDQTGLNINPTSGLDERVTKIAARSIEDRLDALEEVAHTAGEHELLCERLSNRIDELITRVDALMGIQEKADVND